MASNTWQLQEAKAHFSELIRECALKGPQIVTVRGKEEAIVISKQDYDKLVNPADLSFLEFINQSPLKGITLDISRNKDLGRDLEL